MSGPDQPTASPRSLTSVAPLYVSVPSGGSVLLEPSLQRKPSTVLGPSCAYPTTSPCALIPVAKLRLAPGGARSVRSPPSQSQACRDPLLHDQPTRHLPLVAGRLLAVSTLS